jgi:hypothetical protein
VILFCDYYEFYFLVRIPRPLYQVPVQYFVILGCFLIKLFSKFSYGLIDNQIIFTTIFSFNDLTPSMQSDFQFLVHYIGQVDCAEERDICRDLHLTKFPSFVVFKVGGDLEIHYGKPSVQVGLEPVSLIKKKIFLIYVGNSDGSGCKVIYEEGLPNI